jgi:AcrR family transcriptional regulator
METRMGELARVHHGLPRLPRGRSSLAEDAVRSAHRGRLLRAVIAAVAAKGYPAVTVADIVGGAHVSRQAFYAHFADKEECFLAASDEGCELMFRRVADAPRALPGGAGAAERLRAGARAYLEFLIAEPEFARTFLLEVLAAGPRALEHRFAVHKRFAHFTRRWHLQARRENPSWPAVRDEAYLAMVGSFHELVSECVREDRIEDLPKLEDPIMELHLAVFAGSPSPSR